MINETKEQILKKIDELVDFLDSLKGTESICFTDEEVADIIRKEETGARKNYDEALQKFIVANRLNTDKGCPPPQVRRFAVYWGYPGAGKSVMTQKVIERLGREEDCLPFNIIDKDNHRDLFPNLFEHLKGGHIDECERFAGVTIDYVRTILDLSMKEGSRSVLSIGSMGAGMEFKDNAAKAIASGYKPLAIYMAVHPDIAYLSNIYRSASLYDKIIFQNKQLYPRLVSSEYFGRVVNMLPKMIDNISQFQKENCENVDLLVLNRADELLYDSRKPHFDNVREIIEREETRPLNTSEIITINMQLTKIMQNMRYRAENDIYSPCKSEIAAAKTAVLNIAALIRTGGGEMTPQFAYRNKNENLKHNLRPYTFLKAGNDRY